MPLLFNIVLEVLANARKGNKRHTDWEKEITLSLFTNDMIVENPNQSTKKLLKQIRNCNKIVGAPFCHFLQALCAPPLHLGWCLPSLSSSCPHGENDADAEAKLAELAECYNDMPPA